MPIKKLTLGLALLCAGAALAQGTTYKVRNGDFDWAIARRNGISLKELHSANPSVDWNRLKVGSSIVVPGHGHSASVVAVKHEEKASSHHSVGGHVYTVKSGDNNWIIAHNSGTTTSELRRINPNIDLAHLRPGQKVVVPGRIGGDRVVRSEISSKKQIRSRYVMISGDHVTIRRNAARKSGAVAQVSSGLRAAVLDRDGDWYQLRFPKGTVGWVRQDFITASHLVASHEVNHSSRRRRRSGHGYVAYGKAAPAAYSGSDLLERAQQFKGVRYSWGQASRSGTDCSGFTTQVFRSVGVKLPRTSSEQAHVGQQVNPSSMKPGDLVFFHTVRGHRVSHVGIYMGNGKFIHSSSGGGHVQVNSLNEGYYHQRLVGARRVAVKSKKSAVESTKKVEAPKAEVAKAADPAPAPDTKSADTSNAGN